MLLATACGEEEKPAGVLPPERMVNYLIDLHISEAAVQNLRLKRDSAQRVAAVQEKYLLKKHGISDTVFVASYNYYLAHPEELEEIYSAVVDSISLRQSLLKEVK